MKLFDLIPQVLWALAVAAHAYTVLKHGVQKEIPMSEAPTGNDTLTTPTLLVAPPTPVPAPDAPIATAAADVPALAVHPAVAAVVAGVQASQPPHNWATTAASVLQALMPVVQPSLQVSRASPRTQAQVAIGIAALAGILEAFFPHPEAQ